MDLASETPAIIEFGRFRVLPHRRELLADGRPINLGGRTFDVLMALIEGHGAAVGKDLLMRVWPNRIVEESSLHVQISALRNALGPDRNLIRTISGRGYQFTGEIRTVATSRHTQAVAGTAVPVPAPRCPPTNLPEPVSELIGRDDELREILGLAAAQRLVTLTGAGGIGKTRLALAAAGQLLPHFADGAWVAELSPLADPGLVPAAVATAVGLELDGRGVSTQSVAQALAERHLLLVLDTCEHVIGAAAALAEAVLRAGAAVRIFATSREPLRAEGEQTYQVPPLAMPAEDTEAEDDPLRYGAVRLFIKRAQAAAPRFAPDRGASMIAVICRRLDGIPLAIELAAVCVATLGIKALAARLDHRFQLLTSGRRMALPRHQTLRATLDWSYELLTEHERAILWRLAVFAGAFSLEAAGAVLAGAEVTHSEIVAGLTNLVAKSLVATEVDGPVTRYRLLDTTRAYALEKLGESGEREPLARRHAEYYRDLFEPAEAELEARPAAEWLADYGGQIDNLRAALDWAFSPGGASSVAIALTTAAVPVWMHLSLLEECRGRVERALAASGAGASRDARCAMKLHAALGASLLYTRGGVPESGAAWTKGLEIAEGLDNAEYQLRSLWGLWSFQISNSGYRVALDLAQRFDTLAANRSDPNDRLVGERMIGISQHYLGDQLGARRYLEHMLVHYVPPARKPDITRFQFNQRVTARALLSRVLWLQGFPDQAMRAAERNIADARAANHVTSLCYTLAHAACPIALLIGDLTAAEHYIEMLLNYSARHGLVRWRWLGRSYEGVLVGKHGDAATGLRLLRTGLDGLDGVNIAYRFSHFLSEMAEALGRAGQIADGLAAIDEAIERCERTEEHWAMPELLRIKGELVLLQGMPGVAAAAEDHFRQALDWARRQGALSWELRAATSLARLLRDQNRSSEAVALLAPIYDRFTEGFETNDLKAARALIDGFYNTRAHNAASVVALNTGTARRPA